MYRLPRLFVAFTASVALMSACLLAQGTDAVQVITEQGMTRHIAVIADDSMLGRDTPSQGLESTARYIADQFERVGLKPAS